MHVIEHDEEEARLAMSGSAERPRQFGKVKRRKDKID
jgi:hypothetical protein